MFLTKSSSARHSLLVLLLALCCLSSAFSAKITKKVEKPSSTGEKAEPSAAEEAAPPVAEEEEANENNDDEDDDDDDDEEEEEQEADKEAAAAAAVAATTGGSKNPTAVQAATDPTDLSVWGMVRTLWTWLRSDLGESLFGDDDEEKPSAGTGAETSAVEGRTFGKIRRLQMALIPIIFKFGVLSAMVAFLVAIGMKSLFLLKVLVLMNAVAILGKFITLKSTLFGQYEHTAPTFNYPGWNPHAKESWGATGLSGPGGPNGHPPSKEIHLHIHGNAQTQAQLAGQGYNYETQGGWASRSDPYGGYAPTGQFGESQQPAVATADAVPKDTDPMALLPTKYRARHLIR
ncbi:uncharacterized protein [Drosophila pseudoobscura]|uniref:Uncharacterized protein n=1 Tax=Drosophila pseudoobscura pseudoobscura TaxID=46245 RepID=A0A6I8UB30_DROPS|nr:uncharacterized protein LOC4812054 [Drosophila pseudoobscura]